MKKRRVLIFYDYFTPAFKAGGPIQSLFNLVNFLGHQYDFFIYTSNRDLDGTTLNVEKDRWLPFSPTGMIYYSSKKYPSFSQVRDDIKPIHPEVFYINGLYSLANVIWPLCFVQANVDNEVKLIIAPRGMLSPSALAIKKWKKRIYLTILKILIRKTRVYWHATSEEEDAAIRNFVPNATKILIAQNIPNIKTQVKRAKIGQLKPSPLRLVTIAVISPMKNIFEIIEALQLLDFPTHYDIYGPIKDQRYWQACQRQIGKLPAHIRVNYKQELDPTKVQETLPGYHLYVQPSQSENFGHSIFEALQAGLPVITSHSTPWSNLERFACGKNVTPDKEAIAKAINELQKEIDQGKIFRSKDYINSYLQSKNFLKMYAELFD